MFSVCVFEMACVYSTVIYSYTYIYTYIYIYSRGCASPPTPLLVDSLQNYNWKEGDEGMEAKVVSDSFKA